MVVWMKCGATEIGIEDGIVPRANFERLTALECACEEIIAKQTDMLQQARLTARSLVDAANTKARQMNEAGLRAAIASSRRGFEDAKGEGLKHWHAEQSQRRAERAMSHSRVREELASMVVDATRQLVAKDSFEAYFQKALTVLDQLAEDQRALTLTVHPSDRAAALNVLDALGRHWPDGTTVNLLEDENLAPGSALCESSQAWVDASFDQQIRALQVAATRALVGKHAEVEHGLQSGTHCDPQRNAKASLEPGDEHE
jgi:flagellar biosynthesis/type III secretory pathway protein FliH